MPNGVLVHPRFSKRLIDLIAAEYDLMDPDARDPVEVFSAEQRAKVTAWVTSGGAPLGGAVMEQFPNLKAIVCYGTGYDGVDLAAARRKGIVVGHSPGANAAAVADHAMALMLAVMRDVPRLDAFVRQGTWATGARAGIPAKLGLKGCKVGVYGMGAIGEKIASRAAAFEADVQYYSRSRHDNVPYPYHSSLEAMVDWCDVLQLAVRAGNHNRHIIDASMLKRLGSKGFVVNVARGLLIDETALIEALRNKTIAGAALDVFENEPHVNPALFALPNVVLTPHQGGHTIQAHEAMQDCIMRNLAAALAGKPLPHPVPLD